LSPYANPLLFQAMGGARLRAPARAARARIDPCNVERAKAQRINLKHHPHIPNNFALRKGGRNEKSPPSHFEGTASPSESEGTI
jgi:hypothetical protein